MRLLHLAIAAIQMSTVVALPAQSGQGYDRPKDDASAFGNGAKAVAGVAFFVGLGGAAYKLLSSRRGSALAVNDKRYDRETWTIAKQKFVAFCELYEVNAPSILDDRPEAERWMRIGNAT